MEGGEGPRPKHEALGVGVRMGLCTVEVCEKEATLRLKEKYHKLQIGPKTRE